MPASPQTPTLADLIKAYRAILAALAAAPGLDVADAPPGADAEILVLSAEIVSRCIAETELQVTRISPFNAEFLRLRDRHSYAAAHAFDLRTGRAAAINELHEAAMATDGLFRRMMAIPSKTQAGRAAKVRTFMLHAGGERWRGPPERLSWPTEHARALLAEFAGLSADEIAAI